MHTGKHELILNIAHFCVSLLKFGSQFVAYLGFPRCSHQSDNFVNDLICLLSCRHLQRAVHWGLAAFRSWWQ